MIKEKFNIHDIYDLEDLHDRMERNMDEWWSYGSEVRVLKRVIEFLREKVHDDD